MKITFIGTSHGVPAKDRYCSCTMIESNGAVYFIDAGAPLADIMVRRDIDISSFRAVFTTHVHGDHTHGLMQLTDLMNWYYRDSHGDFFITEERFIEAIKQFNAIAGYKEIDEERLHFKLATAGVMYEDENIRVEYIPTKHNCVATYAILVTEGEKRVLFSGDFSHELNKNDVPEVITEDIDAFICEMAHFGPSDIKPYLDKCRAGRVFFNHVFPLAKYDEIKSFKGKYPFEVLSPNDGDEFII